MIEKCKALFLRYKEQILYIFFGGMTTVVDFAVYWFFTRVLVLSENSTVPAQALGVAVAILFAYIVNKLFVFEDQVKGGKALLVQFLSFVSMRLLSGVFQTAALWLLVDKLHFYDMAMKLIVAVVVVILNYIFSKLIIFRKKDEGPKEENHHA